MLDKIFFRRLHLSTSVGIHPHEKSQRQTTIVDLEFDVDVSRAIVSDDVQCTIDYDQVREAIIRINESRHFHLIETLAEAIAQELFKLFPIRHIRLSVSKPEAFTDMEAVGISIERDRASLRLEAPAKNLLKISSSS